MLEPDGLVPELTDPGPGSLSSRTLFWGGGGLVVLFVLFCFETEFLCVIALAVLELAL